MEQLKGLSLFANVGIAEAYLEDLGIDICVANEIDIDSSLSEEIKMQTVLHEIIELVNHHLEIGIPEHRMITQLATALHQIITENNLYGGCKCK